MPPPLAGYFLTFQPIVYLMAVEAMCKYLQLHLTLQIANKNELLTWFCGIEYVSSLALIGNASGRLSERGGISIRGVFDQETRRKPLARRTR